MFRLHLGPASTACVAIGVIGRRVGEDVLVAIAGTARPDVAILIRHLHALPLWMGPV